MAAELMTSNWRVVGGRPLHARCSESPAHSGPIVVLVHGVGVSSRYMIPLATCLAKSFRVYAPDLPGFGLSPGPVEALDVEGLADSLLEWLATVGLNDVMLIANSFGCQVVVEALTRPESRAVSRAVLNGPTVDPAARTMRRQVGRWVANSWREPPTLGLIVLRDYLDCGGRRLFQTFAHALRDEIEAKLPDVRVPTLVIRGERDAICSAAWTEKVAELLADGKHLTMQGVAHTANFSAPEAFAKAVVQFSGATGPT